jgi:hypothetical protein
MIQRANSGKDNGAGGDDEQKQQLGPFFGRIEDSRQKACFRSEFRQLVNGNCLSITPDGEPQQQRRQQYRQEDRQKDDDPDGNLSGVQSYQTKDKDREGGLRLHHRRNGYFLFIFGSVGFFEDRAADTAGCVDVAKDIINRRHGNGCVDTDDFHQRHKNTHQSISKAQTLQKTAHGDADNDRDTDRAGDIDFDDNRGSVIEHVVEQVPDAAGINYQQLKTDPRIRSIRSFFFHHSS